MIPNHNIQSLLKDDLKTTLEDLTETIVDEVVLFEKDVDTQGIVAAAEIAKAITALIANKAFKSREGVEYPVDKIQDFFNDNQASLEILAAQFLQLKETDLYNTVNKLGELLYADNWDVGLDYNKVISPSENTQIILYRAKHGELDELGIRFPNQEARNNFLYNFTPEVIPQKYRDNNPKYLYNPEGYTPTIYPHSPNHVFIPAYEALNKEFGVNCGSENNRNILVKSMGLQKTGTETFKNGEVKNIYSNDLFSTYSKETQANALYFDSSNKIFTHEGAFLKIDTVTGSIKEGQIREYKQILEKDEKVQMDEKLALSILTLRKPETTTCTITIVNNLDNNPELEIKFPSENDRDKWHAVFVGIANLIGVVITQDSLVEKQKDPLSIKVKASHGIGSTGVYPSTPKPKGGPTHFQKPQDPELSINLGDEQLRNFFVTSLNIKGGEQARLLGGRYSSAIYFETTALNLQQQDKQILTTEYNRTVVEEMINSVPQPEALSTGHF